MNKCQNQTYLIQVLYCSLHSPRPSIYQTPFISFNGQKTAVSPADAAMRARRRFDPAKETVGGNEEDIGLEEATPEEIAGMSAPAFDTLPEMHEIQKMTFDHLHALLAMFRSADEKDCGLDEKTFIDVFGKALSNVSVSLCFTSRAYLMTTCISANSQSFARRGVGHTS